MVKKGLLVLLVCLQLLCLPGCFDYRDVEDLDIPVVVAYDTSSKTDCRETEKVAVTGVMINPTPGMEETRTKRWQYKTTADAETK